MQGSSSCARDPQRLAAVALDGFIAEIVRQASQAGLPVPAGFSAWGAGEALQLVAREMARRVHALPQPDAQLCMALRCAVRHWTAPSAVAHFPALRSLFPELAVRAEGTAISVLVRTGRWRCNVPACRWKLCAPETAA